MTQVRFPVSLLLAVITVAAVPAAEQPANPPAAEPADAAPAAQKPKPKVEKPEDVDGEWITSGRIGFFFTSVENHHSDRSNDPAIASTTSSTTLLAQFDGSAIYVRDPWRVENTLQVKYGKQRVQSSGWIENTDLIDYDTIASYSLGEPHFLYGAVGADTVITEDPGDGVFEPGTAKVSTGYGQRYENMLPITDRFEARIGVRAQRRWGRHISNSAKEWEVGPEFIARYERKQTTSLRYWIQYEAFAEFEDMAHVSNLGTAGLDLQVSKFITVLLGLRAYYESEPKDADAGNTSTYDNMSWRTDTLIGLTYTL